MMEQETASTLMRGEPADPDRAGRIAFGLVLSLVFLGAAVMAWQWPGNSGRLPLLCCAVGLICAVAQTVRDAFFAGSRQTEVMDVGFEAGTRPFNAAVQFFGWGLGIVTVTYFVGLPVAIFLFPLLYVFVSRARAGEGKAGIARSIVIAIVVALVCWGFTYAVFDLLLHTPWPESVWGP